MDVRGKWDKMVTRHRKIMMMVVIIGYKENPSKMLQCNYDNNCKDDVQKCECCNIFKADCRDNDTFIIGLKNGSSFGAN